MSSDFYETVEVAAFIWPVFQC